MKTLIKALHFAAILLSGWLVMRSMSHLIRISEKRLRRFLLFFGCSILASMIIFIGDPFNILATTPVFLAIVLLTCEGSIWQRITIALMFSNTIFSFSALRDNYIHDLLFPPELFVLFCIAAVILTAILSWLFPLLACFENTFSRHFGNAVRLALARLPITFFITAVNLLPILVLLFLPQFLGAFLGVWLLIGAAAGAYGNLFYLRRIFKQ